MYAKISFCRLAPHARAQQQQAGDLAGGGGGDNSRCRVVVQVTAELGEVKLACPVSLPPGPPVLPGCCPRRGPDTMGRRSDLGREPAPLAPATAAGAEPGWVAQYRRHGFARVPGVFAAAGRRVVQMPLGDILYGESQMKCTKQRLDDSTARGQVFAPAQLEPVRGRIAREVDALAARLHSGGQVNYGSVAYAHFCFAPPLIYFIGARDLRGRAVRAAPGAAGGAPRPGNAELGRRRSGRARRLHRRFARPFIRYAPDSLTYSMPVFLKR